jgi:type VI secretion system protein ImpA
LIAAYLTEALMVRHGFAGLRDGLRVVCGLLQNCWDDLFPLPDNGDLEPRVAPVTLLMDADRGARLPNRMRDIPLLADPDGVERLSWSYWKSRYCPPKGAEESDSSYAERQAEAERRATRFESALQAATLDQVQLLHDDLQALREAFIELNGVAEQRFGELAPGVSGFRTALEEITSLVRRLVRDKGGGADAEAELGEALAESATPSNGSSTSKGSIGPIQTREDAFRRLAEAAEYLRRTEPQSPIPLLIDRAIHWGRMPFHKLLREIVKDNTARGLVRDLLGIVGDEESSN